MKCAVINFLGSNGDYDAYYTLNKILGYSTEIIEANQARPLDEFDLIIFPGGFSYGDYLRSGILASLTPIMPNVFDYAKKGKFLMGICNGFQILTESGLLPGALMANKGPKFISKFIHLKFNKGTNDLVDKEEFEVIKVPVAHGQGNYYCPPSVLKELKNNNQIVFQYSSEDGDVDPKYNINGSVSNIAGILNKNKNILGLMPHPERAVEKIVGSDDGLKVFHWIKDIIFQKKSI